jgi:hypothetical protein
MAFNVYKTIRGGAWDQKADSAPTPTRDAEQAGVTAAPAGTAATA